LKDKNTIRNQARAMRAGLDKNKKKLFDTKICQRTLGLIDNLSGDSAFIYESYKCEVSTKELILTLQKRSYEIAVPRIIPDNEIIAVDCSNKVLEFSQNPLSKKALTDEMEIKNIDIVLAPVVAFSKNGNRLGYGGGFYDKWFRKNPNPIKIGLAYSCQQFDGIVAESHDIKLDFVISEKKIFEFINQH
tara:strand:- start:567 stop:1133 length:567 start_codon:yes stop_codon:yes gene_type:complete